MQQWIPRTQTLEPKIWGQVGLRQGLYMGLGVFGGIFFLITLAPFGIGPRIAAAMVALAAGAVAGFIKIQGLSPERYLFHRLRFALRRRGSRVWQVPETPTGKVEVELRAPIEELRATSKPSTASQSAEPQRVALGRPASMTPWSECMVQVSAFGLGFYLLTLGAMGTAIAYFLVGVVV